MSVLEFRAVGHSYGQTRALSDFSLSVEAGEIVCLLGPSGCGKTTVLRLAAGLEVLQEGQILLAGKSVADPTRSLAPEERQVGLVFQDYALFPHLSVFENVAYGVGGIKGKERTGFVEEALARLALSGTAHKFPHMLSGGQQSRVALARALATNPRLMLLDEPFSSLDLNLRREVRDLTLHVLKESGAASLLVTHDPEEAMFLADRIALMDKGQLVQIGTPSELYFRPASAFVAAFFGEVNRFRGRVSRGRALVAIGSFGAELLPEQTAVEVLVRSEAIELLPLGASDKSFPRAEVMTSRFLGRTSLVHLSLEAADGSRSHIHVRKSGRFLPQKGQLFTLEIEPSLVFVFALGEGDSGEKDAAGQERAATLALPVMGAGPGH